MSKRKVNPKKRNFDVAFKLKDDSEFNKLHRPAKHFRPNQPDNSETVQNPSSLGEKIGAAKFNFGQDPYRSAQQAKKGPNQIGNDDSF